MAALLGLTGPVLGSEPQTVPGNSFVAMAYQSGLREADGLRGSADDLVNPGLAHEPNTPRDAYPGAVFSTQPDTAGSRNTYRGYQDRLYDLARNRMTGRLWLDVQMHRVLNPFHAGATSPLGVVTLEGSATSELQVAPAPAGARPLGPGVFGILGRLGAWHDTPTTTTEEVSASPLLESAGLAEAATVTYTVPPDGWVGDVVSRTGAYRYKGYYPAECVVQGQAGAYEHALCHPHLDGTITDPNDYDASGGEFQPLCQRSAMWAYLQPYDRWGRPTAWSVPVFRLVDYQGMWTAPETGPRFEDWTGRSGALPLESRCEDGHITPVDLVVLPQGATGQAGSYASELVVRTSVEAKRTLCHRGWYGLICHEENVLDVDEYAPWLVLPGT